MVLNFILGIFIILEVMFCTPFSCAHDLQFPDKSKEFRSDYLSEFITTGHSLDDLRKGLIDAQPIISNAINRYRHIVLPCGEYRIEEPFGDWSKDGISLSGVSTGCVNINVYFSINNEKPYLFYLSGHYQSISNINIIAKKKMISGSAIYLNYVTGTHLHDLLVMGPFWNGVYIYGSNNVHLDHIYARPPFLDGQEIPNPQNGAAFSGNSFITLDGNKKNGKINIDTYISNVNISQYKYGINYIYASGVYCNGIDVVGAKNGHIFTPGQEENVNGIQMINVLGDTSFDANWFFPNTGGGVFDFLCTNCWASSSYNGAGVEIENYHSSQLNFSNSISLNNSQSGLKIEGGTQISWVGGAIEMNNTKLNNNMYDYPDVSISGASGSLDWLRIQDVFIGRGGIMYMLHHKKNQATYAIDMSALSSLTHVLISNVQTSGHMLGVIKFPAEKTNISISNVMGD